MWPFRRNPEAPAVAGPHPVPAPPIRRDWAGLAPIQRLIGAHPLTAPSDRFSDDLATHHDPSVSMDTMGHQVSADAPAGLVLSLARPTTRSDGPVMIPRPRVQRREAGAVIESGEWDGDAAAPEPARPTPFPASGATVAARELPVVAPAPAVPRLVSLPPDAEPIPVPSKLQRASATSLLNLGAPAVADIESPGGPASLPAPRLTLGQARRLGLGAPIARVPDHGVQRAASDSMAMPLAAPAPESSRAMPAASPSAPEPLEAMPLPSLAPLPPTHVRDATPAMPASEASALPAAPTSSPEPAALEMPQPSLPSGPPAGTSPATRLDLPLVPRIGLAPSEPASSAAQPPEVQASVMPVQTTAERAPLAATLAIQRVSDGESPDAPALDVGPSVRDSAPPNRAATSRVAMSTLAPQPAGLPRVGAAATAATAAASSPAATLAPLVSARPLRPTATIQRSAELVPDRIAPRIGLPQEEGISSWTAAARTDRGAPVHEASLEPMGPTALAADAFGAQVFTEVEPMAMPVRQAREPDNLGGERQPPSLSLASRGRETPAGRRPASSAPSVQRATTGLSRSELTLAPVAASATPAAQRAAALWDTGTEAAPSPGAAIVPSDMVQRAPDPDAPATEASPPGAAGAMATASAAGDSEKDMDELAGKLYDRIRGRLRTELLVDRERAGLLTDWR